MERPPIANLDDPGNRPSLHDPRTQTPSASSKPKMKRDCRKPVHKRGGFGSTSTAPTFERQSLGIPPAPAISAADIAALPIPTKTLQRPPTVGGRPPGAGPICVIEKARHRIGRRPIRRSEKKRGEKSPHLEDFWSPSNRKIVR